MNFKSKRAIFIIGIILVAALIFSQFLHNEGVEIVYKTAKVDRGAISSYVSATGTLNPTSTVEVGSQISGVIKNVYADFNSVVKKGGALADIEPAPFSAALSQAQADRRKAQSDLQLTKAAFEANEELYEKRLISKEEYDDSKTKYSAALALLYQANAQVQIATSNLSSTTIRSPIDGIVISRRANVGQGVSPGKESSSLFLVAEDLAKMSLDAHVSEADIGKVKDGQETVFTVDAYPNETFDGKVHQVRNEPIKTGNVVTYDVVILFDNVSLKLKPGMTAEVKILAAHKENALRIPRAALRFIPPPSALVDEKSREGGSQVIWTAGDDEKLKSVQINPGISDDFYTEILDGSLGEGEEVIVEAVQKGGSSDSIGIPLPKPQRF